jgi:hypothetical protein
MHMGIIKATGKKVDFPPGKSRVSFKGEKISANKDLTTGPMPGLALLWMPSATGTSRAASSH